MVLTNGQLGEVVIYVLRPPPGKENDQQMLLCGNGEQQEIGEKEDQAVEVDCRGGDEGICLLQDRVFQAFEMRKFNTQWLSADEAMAMHGSNQLYRFMLARFRGPVFDHLRSIGCRIIGSSLALCSLQPDGGPKIGKRFGGRPIFSQHMANAIVCFSGLSREQKRSNGELVRWMGGIVTGDYIADVTHLVTDFASTRSPKFRHASRLAVPVLTTEWVNAAWALALEGVHDVCCTGADFYDQYRTRSFTRLRQTQSASTLAAAAAAPTRMSRVCSNHAGAGFGGNFAIPSSISFAHSRASGNRTAATTGGTAAAGASCSATGGGPGQAAAAPRVEWRDSTEISTESFVRELMHSKATAAQNRSLMPANDLSRWEEESDLMSSVSYSKQAARLLSTSTTSNRPPPPKMPKPPNNSFGGRK